MKLYGVETGYTLSVRLYWGYSVGGIWVMPIPISEGVGCMSFDLYSPRTTPFLSAQGLSEDVPTPLTPMNTMVYGLPRCRASRASRRMSVDRRGVRMRVKASVMACAREGRTMNKAVRETANGAVSETDSWQGKEGEWSCVS